MIPKTRKQSFFDAELAVFPTHVLPVSDVVDLLPNTHAQECVERYRQAMQEGTRFPPISVIRLGARYVIADGHKRFSACQSLGAETVIVEVWTRRRWLADQRDQFRRNLSKNGAIVRGLFTNPRESRRLLLATLGHWRRVAAALLGRLKSERP